MYPQAINQKILGKFIISKSEVIEHYKKTRDVTSSKEIQVLSEYQDSVFSDHRFYVALDSDKYVAYLPYIFYKHILCCDCGKAMSTTEVGYPELESHAEYMRGKFIESEKKINLENEARIRIGEKPTSKIKDPYEIEHESHSFMSEFLGSILDGLDDNNRLYRVGDKMISPIIRCYSCTNGNWWSQ